MKYFTYFFLLIAGFCHAQKRVIDDSTKQVYGPKTTKFFKEIDVFKNHKTLYEIDTVYDGFHRQNLYQIQRGAYQELGNVGTASKAIYYQSPEETSTFLGYNAYKPYYLSATDTKYYDTKSPFTEMTYVQGGLGQNILSFTHARNLKPNLNITLEINRITASKQYAGPTSQEDKLIDMWASRLSGNYTSKDKKYLILGNYTHFHQATTEQGGVIPRDNKLGLSELYDYANYYAKLLTAKSDERQNAFHLHQEYVLANGFQLYNTTDFQLKYNTFSDNNKYGFQSGLYPLKPQKDTTFIKSNYHLFENKAGIKGNFSGYNYRLHLRNRLYSLNATWQEKLTNSETFFGGWTAYYFADSTRIEIEGEQQLIGANNKNKQIKANYTGKWLNAGYVFSSLTPSLLQTAFKSNVLNWQKILNNVQSQVIYAQSTLKHKEWSITPNIELSRISNYIYFDTLASAKQSPNAINISRIGFEGTWEHKKMQASWQSYFTAKSDSSNLMRIPAVFLNAQFAYNYVYAKVLHLQSGIDMSYRSAYKADTYMPLIQQFYLQDKVTVGNYPVIDIFTNMRINRVRLFFRVSHINQGFLPRKVNYNTPYYPAIRRSWLQMGVNWPLFD